MSEFKTPGVYVKEVTTLPPSVAQVETAIPAFVGYTDKRPSSKPKRITSLLEYETHFGKAKPESIELKDTVDKGLTLVKPKVDFLMYYSLQMYFANGGGPCYIVSVGNYLDGVDKVELKAGLDLVKLEDEPTLIVIPDAVSLDQEKFYAICQDALNQANELKNRFVILDTYLGDSTTPSETDDDEELTTIEYFRKRIQPSTYGAVYFPHLKTVLNYTFDETETVIDHKGLQPSGASNPFFVAAVAELGALAGQAISGASEETLENLLIQTIVVVETVNETADDEISLTAVDQLLEDIDEVTYTQVATAITALKTILETTAEDKEGHAHGKTLESLRLTNSALYSQIKKEITSLAVVLPPSSAMAGIYARIDSTKGVWKAPANEGFNYVIAPTEKVSHDEQEGLNVDTAAGKSINAIRSFTGKGTLVWGARTLYGNDNEWKYVSVRRLFIMVEESVKRATEKFLFEPNEANTWVRAKGMIKNYLTSLWMEGALAGSTPEEAFYVSVGGETISAQDILEGRMNIEIGLAAVRPAEFIILRFSHKLQES